MPAKPSAVSEERLATPDDAESLIRVHRRAVRSTAASVYPTTVLEEWAPLPVKEAEIAALARRIRVGEEVAVIVCGAAGEVLGFGSIAPGKGELRAVYVDPDYGGRGVGASIMRWLEGLARDLGETELSLDASQNAERFYARHGYVVTGRGRHVLRSGREMACVHMRKRL
jgi:GNAT superfamily N-acetyltransferase